MTDTTDKTLVGREFIHFKGNRYRLEGFAVDRIFLMVSTDAYDVEQLENDSRIVMHFKPSLAPYLAAVLPLSKEQREFAKELQQKLAKKFHVVYDETASIGKRYRRQDAIGTPFCITVDFDTATDNSVTIRERDSMKQVRLPIDKVKDYLEEALEE